MLGKQVVQNPQPSLTSDLRPPWPAAVLAKAFGVAIWRRRLASGFTLIELLVVIGIVIVLTALLAPAFTNLKTAGDVTNAAYTIKGVLEQARIYAMANNTYVYVGFYEEATTASTPTNFAPPYPGKGRLLLGAVASKDGTTSCEDAGATSTSPIKLIAANITPLGKVTRIEGVHMTEIGAPPSPMPPNAGPNSIVGRPDVPYTYASPSFDYQNRINSDDTHTTYNHTMYPFDTQGYTFYKTVRFNPRGEASINATYDLRRAAEIGLVSTHGSQVPGPPYSGNVVAIQFGGTDGIFRIYRQ